MKLPGEQYSISKPRSPDGVMGKKAAEPAKDGVPAPAPNPEKDKPAAQPNAPPGSQSQPK
jgi:hypothetical protein